MTATAKYGAFRAQIADGDLIGMAGNSDWHRLDKLGRRGSLQSWLIRWWTQPSWKPWRLAAISHPAIACWLRVGGNTGLWVLEQVGTGVRVVRLSWLLQTYPGRIYHKPLLRTNDNERKRIVSIAANLQGGRYASLWQCAATGCKWRKDVDSKGRMCSEYVAEVYGFPQPFAQYTPADVWHDEMFGQATELLI